MIFHTYNGKMAQNSVVCTRRNTYNAKMGENFVVCIIRHACCVHVESITTVTLSLYCNFVSDWCVIGVGCVPMRNSACTPPPCAVPHVPVCTSHLEASILALWSCTYSTFLRGVPRSCTCISRVPARTPCPLHIRRTGSTPYLPVSTSRTPHPCTYVTPLVGPHAPAHTSPLYHRIGTIQNPTTSNRFATRRYRTCVTGSIGCILKLSNRFELRENETTWFRSSPR